MKTTKQGNQLTLRRLPASARTAASEKTAERSERVARAQFSRTFADVLSGRFGGRWSVDWEGTDRSPLASDRDGQRFTGKK